MSIPHYEVDEREFGYQEFASQKDYIKYSKDVEHQHSKGVQLILDLCSSYIERSEQANAAGKKAVWTMGLWETPLIYACDTIPISFTEAGRLASPNALTIAENYFQLPREACSMVKAALGEWYLRKNRVTRVLGSSAFCEPYGQAIEMLKSENYDVHFLDIPAYGRKLIEGKDEKGFVGYIVEELKTAAEWLTGNKLDEKKLGVEIKRVNQSMKKIRRILALRIKKPLFIKSLATMFTIVGTGHYFGDPDAYMKALDLLIEELEAAPEEKFKSDNLVPVLWLGARGQEFGVFKTLDNLNAAILGWWLPTPYIYDYDENSPPLESIARYLLNAYGRGGNMFQRIDDLLAWLKEQGVSAKGAVLYGYFGCSINTSELTRSYLSKKGISGFIVEGTFQVGPPTGQLITRLKAFLEMLSVG
jgi:benzoyl-CoA reductase/2-hydroxyglutaryl-CoA dehydratase subunit BcrC/BadD/HgdB